MAEFILSFFDNGYMMGIPAFMVLFMVFIFTVLIFFWFINQNTKYWRLIIGLLFFNILYFIFVLISVRDYAYSLSYKETEIKYYSDNYKNISCKCTIVVESTETKIPYMDLTKVDEKITIR